MSSTTEVDSKLAAGSKKSAPFLLALAEVWEVLESDLDRRCVGEDPHFHLFRAWMRRRQGEILEDGHRNLAALAAECLYLLGKDTVGVSLDSLAWLPAAFAELWRVSQFGEIKHGPNNWMQAQADGMWHYEAALWRHWVEKLQGDSRATDSECFHSAHMAWNALMLLEMELRGVVNPDWAEKI